MPTPSAGSASSRLYRRLLVLAVGCALLIAVVAWIVHSGALAGGVLGFTLGEWIECGAVVALSISLGFGMRTIMHNLVSYAAIKIFRPFQGGDLIDIDGYTGAIEKIGLFHTRLRGVDNTQLKVPTWKAQEKLTVIWTISDEKVCVAVRVGVVYGSAVEVTMRLLAQAAIETPGVYREPAPVVLFKDFGDKGLIFEVHFWVGMPTTMIGWKLESAVRLNIERLLRRDGIEIALPQQDVHLHAEKPLNVMVKQDRGRML